MGCFNCNSSLAQSQFIVCNAFGECHSNVSQKSYILYRKLQIIVQMKGEEATSK